MKCWLGPHPAAPLLQAIEWVRSTYFYVRVRRNPALYGVPRQLAQAAGGARSGSAAAAAAAGQGQGAAEGLERWLRDRLVLGTLKELADNGMVSTCGDRGLP